MVRRSTLVVRRLAAAALLGWNAALLSAAAASPTVSISAVQGRLADGALWRARVPSNWNGTLLLYSHGYAVTLHAPELAPQGVEEPLIAEGFALAASSYAQPGWALEQAVPDQLATLDAFGARFGKPRRTIAWGESMGGLVTVALAEASPQRFAGALPECGSLAGSLGMMNEALDGAFVFRQLVAPHEPIRLLETGDDRANGARVQAALDAAMRSAAGRARIALASALAQIPTWTQPGSSEPAASDLDAQLAQLAASFVMGVFLPRADQERRAGGPFSWNVGVDYREQLARSGRRDWVETWYRLAGLDLDKDLAVLRSAPRLSAAPRAIAYMRAHYVPSGELRIPLLSAHTLGDGATVPTQQAAYRAAVHAAGHDEFLALAWVRRAGHCNFTPAEHVALLRALLERITSGAWHTSAAELNRAAQAGAEGGSAFVEHESPGFLRPCGQDEPCAAEPGAS